MTDYLPELHRLPAALQANRVAVTLTRGCEVVPALGEQTFCPSRELVKRTTKDVRYTMTVSDAFYMLDDLEQRSTAEGGYDQPAHWFGIAKANAKRLRAVLHDYITGRVDAA